MSAMFQSIQTAMSHKMQTLVSLLEVREPTSWHKVPSMLAKMCVCGTRKYEQPGK